METNEKNKDNESKRKSKEELAGLIMSVLGDEINPNIMPFPKHIKYFLLDINQIDNSVTTNDIRRALTTEEWYKYQMDWFRKNKISNKFNYLRDISSKTLTSLSDETESEFVRIILGITFLDNEFLNRDLNKIIDNLDAFESASNIHALIEFLNNSIQLMLLETKGDINPVKPYMGRSLDGLYPFTLSKDKIQMILTSPVLYGDTRDLLLDNISDSIIQNGNINTLEYMLEQAEKLNNNELFEKFGHQIPDVMQKWLNSLNEIWISEENYPSIKSDFLFYLNSKYLNLVYSKLFGSNRSEDFNEYLAQQIAMIWENGLISNILSDIELDNKKYVAAFKSKLIEFYEDRFIQKIDNYKARGKINSLKQLMNNRLLPVNFRVLSGKSIVDYLRTVGHIFGLAKLVETTAVDTDINNVFNYAKSSLLDTAKIYIMREHSNTGLSKSQIDKILDLLKITYLSFDEKKSIVDYLVEKQKFVVLPVILRDQNINSDLKNYVSKKINEIKTTAEEMEAKKAKKKHVSTAPKIKKSNPEALERYQNNLNLFITAVMSKAEELGENLDGEPPTYSNILEELDLPPFYPYNLSEDKFRKLLSIIRKQVKTWIQNSSINAFLNALKSGSFNKNEFKEEVNARLKQIVETLMKDTQKQISIKYIVDMLGLSYNTLYKRVDHISYLIAKHNQLYGSNKKPIKRSSSNPNIEPVEEKEFVEEFEKIVVAIVHDRHELPVMTDVFGEMGHSKNYGSRVPEYRQRLEEIMDTAIAEWIKNADDANFLDALHRSKLKRRPLILEAKRNKLLEIIKNEYSKNPDLDAESLLKLLGMGKRTFRDILSITGNLDKYLDNLKEELFGSQEEQKEHDDIKERTAEAVINMKNKDNNSKNQTKQRVFKGASK